MSELTIKLKAVEQLQEDYKIASGYILLVVFKDRMIRAYDFKDLDFVEKSFDGCIMAKRMYTKIEVIEVKNGQLWRCIMKYESFD